MGVFDKAICARRGCVREGTWQRRSAEAMGGRAADEPLVSTDIIGETHSTVVDLELMPDDPERAAARVAWDGLHGRATSFAADRARLEAVTVGDVRRVARDLFPRTRRDGAQGHAPALLDPEAVLLVDHREPQARHVAILGPSDPGLEDRLRAGLARGLPGAR